MAPILYAGFQAATGIVYSFIRLFIHSFIHSFIHVEHLYNATSRQLHRGAVVNDDVLPRQRDYLLPAISIRPLLRLQYHAPSLIHPTPHYPAFPNTLSQRKQDETRVIDTLAPTCDAG